jgi:hypothetical protein
MCLQRMGSIQLIVCASLIITACYSPPSFKLDKEAQQQMMKLPGIIDMELSSGTFKGAEVWHYTIIHGEMTLVDRYTIPPVPSIKLKTPPRILFEKDVPEGMPKVPGCHYYGNYRVSPNRSYIALSLAPENAYYSTGFVIVRQDTKEVTFQKEYKGDKEYMVDDVVWSPDSSMLAVLESTSRRRYGLIDIISAAVGHVNEESTFYLSVYNSEGRLLVKSHLASGLVNPSCCIYWREK